MTKVENRMRVFLLEIAGGPPRFAPRQISESPLGSGKVKLPRRGRSDRRWCFLRTSPGENDEVERDIRTRGAEVSL